MSRVRWTDDLVEAAIKDSMRVLGIDRMPTAPELQAIGKNSLHVRISRTLKYSGWAQRLGLQMKSDGETRKGDRYEAYIKNLLKEKGYDVQDMSTRHPYDLMVDGSVKIDVKSCSAHHHFPSRAHTFPLSKKHATCDLYICVALTEEGEVENIFIIPSHLVEAVTLNMGRNSKYNKFIDRWDYIKTYAEFYASIA